MTPDEYQQQANVTEFTPDFVRLEGQSPEHNRMVAQLLHAFLGLSSEVGELADALKKHLIYGKALDEINVLEEIGDLSWYNALALTAVKRTMSECMQTNINKLRARYGDKFTQAAALVRDLDKERKTLEGTP
jgi:NTP pyrophosphatase (non-canonical NTP hydrolase)